MKTTILKGFTYCIIFLAVTVNCSAAVYWDNDSTDQQWDTQSNWSGDAGPTTSPAIEFGTRGGPNECIIDTGTTANEPTKLYVPLNADSEGSLLISGGDLTASQNVYVGYRGDGIIKMTSGSISTSTCDVDLGTNADANGILDISGGTVTAKRFMYVGNSGIGRLVISNGNVTVTDYDFIVADDADSIGIVDMSGGTILPNRYIYLGDAGSATLNLSGGTISTSGYDFILGAKATGSATVNLSSGTLASDKTIRVGGYGTTVINMTGGMISTTTTTGKVKIPVYSTGSGTINLYGGVIDTYAFEIPYDGGLLDVRDGTLIINGDKTSTINTYITAGKITAFGGDGEVDYDYNITNAGKTTVIAYCLKAYDPDPANTAVNIPVGSILSWEAGLDATSHDVYFGTTSPGTFQGNQAGTTFDPGTLAPNTTYYWRIDEVADGYTTTGTVWSFTTNAPPSQSTNPCPGNGSTGIGRQVDLQWAEVDIADSYDVYFGTTSPGTFQGNQTGTTFDPGTLNVNTTYYWRIDPKNTSGTTTGTVWSFTTIESDLTVQNDSYSVVQDTNFVLTVTNKDCSTSLQFTPEFTVFYSATEPDLATASQLTAEWSGSEDLYDCGSHIVLEPYKAEIVDANLIWTYPEQTDFSLTVTVDMTSNFKEPVLSHTLTAKSTGWYMAGYTGAAECNPSTMEKIVQPTMAGYMPDGPMDGTNPTFPSEPQFAQEFLSTLPAVITRDVNDINCAIIVHPDAQSCRFLHYKNVESGLCIRNPEGNAQPTVFAPEIGCPAQKFELVNIKGLM